MTTAQDEFNQLMGNRERRTGHPEDDDDADGRSFLNLSDSEEEDHTPPASAADEDGADLRPTMSQARNTIPLTRYNANTGPKGVIADAQNFRDSRRIHRASMHNVSSLSSQAVGKQPQRNVPISEKSGYGDDDDEEDLEEDDDSEFMNKWRNSRLKELQSGERASKVYSQGRGRQIWGGLTTVDGNAYLDAVDKSPADTVVVVYIYDDYSQVSVFIEECIRTLAQKHLDVRFVKLHFEDAEMEPAGVPALLAYRGGDKFAGLVPMIQEIPDEAELSAKTLETVLKRHQILQ